MVTDAENLGDHRPPLRAGLPPLPDGGDPVGGHRPADRAGDRRLVTDDRGLPTGDAPVAGTEFDFSGGRLLGTTRLDTAFTGLHRHADGRLPGGARPTRTGTGGPPSGATSASTT